MCLLGTIKCKGAHTKDRPWRRVTLDSGDHVPTPLPDPAAWLASLDPKWTAEPEAPRPASISVPAVPGKKGRPDPYTRARMFVAKMDAAISGHGGHSQTFKVATTLIIGFDLPRGQAEQILWDYNKRCVPPWTDAELADKLDEAEKLTDKRGELLEQGDEWHDPYAGYAASLAETARGVGAGGNGDGQGNPPLGGPTPAPGGDGPRLPVVPRGEEDNPHRLAKSFLNSRYYANNIHILHNWQENWWGWDGSYYRLVPLKEMENQMNIYID
jgi:hypothetical protein